MQIYYSIVDPFPPFRSDLVELFAVELREYGLDVTWYMSRSDGAVGSPDPFLGQTVHVPSGPLHPKIVRQIGYWLTDIFLILGLILKPPRAFQFRDKLISTLVGLMVSKALKVPLFYWSSYPFPEHNKVVAIAKGGFLGYLGQIKAAIRFWLLYRVICRHADHVFVQSQRMKDDMHGYGIPYAKMTPVPMGISARMASWVASHPVPVVPHRIVYLGTLASVRRLEMLLDAFSAVRKRFPLVELIFVGDGDHPAEREGLEQHANALGLLEGVRFTGFVPMEEAWKLAASAAVCVSPFYPTQVLASASPTKLVEYLALGRPVVCNDHPEQSQIIAESGAGLCVPWSAEAFAGAIGELLENPAEAERLAARGPAWVAEHRTYPIIAKAVWEKYCELIGPDR